MRRSAAERLGPLLRVALLALFACTGPFPPPVVDRSISDLPADGIHVVRDGETLYAIAFRYGLDFRELAAINDIDEPYLIRSGRRLRLTPGSARRRSGARQSAGGSTRDRELSWTWPASGELVTPFSAESKGIDVAGKAGDSVRAAAAGEVVYAGSGLRGYGKLVIVKHDEHTLSAYGHNRRLSVKEGDTVRGGQELAQMGRRADRSLVHFEIRRDGKPLDPVTVLPAR